MKSISVAFDVLEIGKVASVVHEKTSSYIIFDIKIDFTRKAR